MILVLFAILSNLVNCEELITLKDKDHVLCVTDNFESAMFVEPPVVQKQKNTSVLSVNWNDEWILKKSTDVTVNGVTDKRWEDFEVIYTDTLQFESVTSLSLSQYGGVSINVIINDVEKIVEKGRNLLDFWSHHTQWNPISAPVKITITSDEKAYWKIHSYELRWAETISQQPTTINLPQDAPCIMLYMYICSHCTLNVKGSRFESSLHGTHQGTSEEMADWQILKVESESSITLLRNTSNGATEGQWGIDIRRCPVMVSNRTILDVQLENPDEEVDRLCKTLKPISNNDQTSIFDCNVGTLGQNCDLQCEDLLGSENKNCEEYTICDSSSTNSECFCSWGYQGQSCNTSCSTGTWGLSCQNKCSGCDSCSPQSGDCNNSATLSQGIGLMVLLGMSIAYSLF